MTSFERILSSLKGEEPDRVAVVPEVFGVTAKTMGYSIYEYVTDPLKLATSQLKAREIIGHDVLFAFADLSVEAEAIGCELVYNRDSYPVVKKPIVQTPEDIEKLNIPEPGRTKRMKTVIKATEILRDAVKDTCMVASCVMGPLSIAGQLMGIDNLLYQIVDCPELVERVLDFTEEVSRVYGKALLRAGAHCHIIFDPMASPMVIPLEVFKRFELPRLRRLYAEFKKEGSLISWLSIAGNTKKILPYYEEAGVELATVDYTVSINEAFELLKSVSVNGNIRPYAFVSRQKNDLALEAERCLKEAEGRVNFLLGSGCEIPIEAAIENIMTLTEMVLKLRSRM